MMQSVAGWFAAAVIVIFAIAATALVLSGGTRVTVISISDIHHDSLESVVESLPEMSDALDKADGEESLVCTLQGCCAEQGGVDKLDLSTGNVMCKDETISTSCRCEHATSDQLLFKIER